MYSEQTPFWKNHEFLVGHIAVLVAVFGLYWFPKQADPVYDLMTYSAFFGIFPLLVIHLVLKQSLEAFGFGWGRWQRGLLLTVLGWIIFGCVMVPILFKTRPPIELFAPAGIRTSFRLLLIYTGISAVVLLGLEVFFRGLIMTLWRRRFGAWAIGIQTLALWAWLALRDSTPSTLAEGVILTFVPLWAGCVAWQSRSVLSAFLFSFGASILLNSLLLIFL